MRDFFENSPKCLTPSLDSRMSSAGCAGERVLWEEGIIQALVRPLLRQCLGVAISHFDFVTVL